MRGRGSFRGNQRGNGRERNTQPQGGPLMTSHLRELDIELEILKRKRDMIQQEHELLNREREFNLKRQYQQEPSTSYSQSSFRDGYSSNYYRQQGNKRQAVEPMPARRYEQPPRVEPWQQNTVEPRPKPYHNPKPQPLLGLYTNAPKSFPQNPKPQIRKNFNPPPKKSLPARKDFNPTKVTKQKIQTVYLQKSQKVNPPKTIVEENYILQPNVKPSAQVNGRLELALGSILKDIKQIEPDLINTSMTYYILKMIKQIIRGRIRNVMTGQAIGHVPDIVANYRKKYPKETDAELVELGKKAQTYNLSSLGEISCLETENCENPRKYFKSNLTKLLSQKMDEIFEHVKTAFANKDNASTILKQMDNVVDLTEQDVVANANVVETNQMPKEGTEDIKNWEKNIAKAEAYSKLMDALLEERLPKVLPKFKQNIMTMLDTTKEFYNSKSKIEEEAIKIAVDLVSKNFIEGENKKNGIDKKDVPMNEDDNSVAGNTSDAPEANSGQSSVTTNGTASVPTTPAKIIDFPYFVKLIGRPELPARQAVYDFLEQFKPASIKKHKTVGNLLVLGFNDKEGYEKILEAGEVSIGANTMIIKASEKVNNTPQKETPVKKTTDSNICETPTKTQTSSAEKTESKEGNKSADSSLSIASDLDEQITNLLTTIRNSDEQHDGESADKNTSDSTENTKEKDNDNSDNNTTNDLATNKDAPLETISEVEEKAENGENNEDEIVEKINGKAETESQNGGSNKVDAKDTEEKPSSDASKREKTPEGNGEKDQLNNLKESGRATPTRSSARLATVTPSSIKTRRASRLAQNN